jgi:hypothetical protein
VAYNSIQPAAFIATQELKVPLQTLTFPASWRQPILDLHTAGRSESARARARQVPIRRLNALLRIAAPDLVSTTTRAALDEANPWLFATRPFSPAVLRTFFYAWLHDLPYTDEGKALILPTIDKLDPAALHWQPDTVDLLAHSVSPSGTALPQPHLYTLLADYVAGLIAAADVPYEHAGRSLRFRQIAVNPASDCAELVSWPPLEHKKTYKGTSRSWYYSATLKIALRTVVGDTTLRLHVNSGIRRWTAGEVHTKGRYGASTYLLSTSPFVAGAPTPQKFAVANLFWNRNTKDMDWRNGGPGQLLTRVGALERLPAPDLLGRKSDAWMFGRDGVTAAVAYHTTMRGPNHEVGTGLMPLERSRLTQWVRECLAPRFDLDQPLARVKIGGKPTRALHKHASVPKPKPGMSDADLDELAASQNAVREHNEALDAENARTRRAQLAKAVPDGRLTVFLLHQGEGSGMRNRLLDTIEKLLDLPPRTPSANSWTWRQDDFILTIHAQPLGALGAPLGNGTNPSRGHKHDAAVAARRHDVATTLRRMTETTGDTAQLALVELDGANAFKVRTTDPKFAVRLGCRDANMVSQFIRPETGTEDDDASTQHRAEAAWQDGFRQLGVRFIPQHRITTGIPDDLQQLAFWIIKRRNDDTNTHQLFVPIAVLIRPGQNHVMGKADGMDKWVPYPELLKHVAGSDYQASPSNEDEQQRTLAAFIRATINQFRNTQTLIVTQAHNIRYRLPAVQNAHLLYEQIQFGDVSPQRLSLFGKHLRLVRVSGSERLETPQSWAAGDDRVGISEGLWARPDGNGDTTGARVFYSTVEKPATHTKIAVELAKLTHDHKVVEGVGPADRKERDLYDPSKSAWNPELLELVVAALPAGENPATWAGFLHQQRFCFDDYRAALSQPLILHLAELATEYAIPTDDGEEGDDAPAEPAEEQLTFDFDI